MPQKMSVLLLNNDVNLPVPVLILEDDAIMQQRLKGILRHLGYEQDVLLIASNLKEAMQIIAKHHVAFALVDLGLPDGHGTTLIEALHRQDPSSLILVISAWSTQEAILNAIQAGATGYVLKERDDFEVSLSIRSLLRGGAPIDPFIAQQILSKLVVAKQKSDQLLPEHHLLSSRELEILEHVAQGLSNKEIADKICLSRYTVECHIKHIYRKLSVSNRAKAINTARSMGLLS